MLPLRWDGREGRALIYVYRPGRLAKDLNESAAQTLLRSFGYPCGSPERCVVKLMNRLRESGKESFPHEVGLFLGYPTEDVIGFMERGPRASKCTGCWKVYGDERKAKQTFARYKKCTAAYCARYRNGTPLERLAQNEPS